MGSRFDITIVAENENFANKNIDEAIAEISRIEKLISTKDESSEAFLINKNAGVQPVKVSAELFGLIERAIKISEITKGAFDITYASMNQVWKFDGSMIRPPTPEEISKSISNIGYQHIILNKEDLTVFLDKEGLKIGFEAIAKGYAADMAKALMQSNNVFAGIINASGDLTTWGRQASGEKWIAGIANPIDRTNFFAWLPVDESSVATSWNHEKYVVFKGEKYSHIINPRTGYPSVGINSVSIFSKSAEFCDALATAVFNMGVETGLLFINELEDTEIIIVDSENKIHKSAGIKFDENEKL